MTDRVKSLTVVLAADTRDDDIESLVEAILHFKNVISVGTNIVSIEDFSARQRIRQEMVEKLWAALKE